MFEPLSFLVGANTLYFNTDPFDTGEFATIRQPAASVYVETLDGTYYDPYGTQKVAQRPGVIEFKVNYKPDTISFSVLQDAQDQLDIIQANYIGYSGTLSFEWGNVALVTKPNCVARLRDCWITSDAQKKATGFVYFHFVFDQKTVLNVP